MVPAIYADSRRFRNAENARVKNVRFVVQYTPKNASLASSF